MPGSSEVNVALGNESSKSSRVWIMAASGFVVVALGGSLTWLIMFRNDGPDPVASKVGANTPTVNPTINPTISPTINPTISPIINPTISPNYQGTTPGHRADPVLLPVSAAPADHTAATSEHPPQRTDPTAAAPSSAAPAAPSPPPDAAAQPGAPARCSGVKQWLNIESVHAVFLKDSTYKLTLVLANKLDKPISVATIFSSTELNDDEHNPSPRMDYDFPTQQWYERNMNYAKSAYNTGMRITSEEPQPITFHSGSVRASSKHVSLSTHLVIAEDKGNDGIVASHTVLRCNDLPVE